MKTPGKTLVNRIISAEKPAKMPRFDRSAGEPGYPRLAGIGSRLRGSASRIRSQRRRLRGIDEISPVFVVQKKKRTE